MDITRGYWYFPGMSRRQEIPVFTLYGETGEFPDLVYCESYQTRAPLHGWQITPHRHTQVAQLQVIERGSADAKVDGIAISLETGSFLFVPPQKVHEIQFEPGTTGQVISFPMSVLNTIGPASQDILGALNQTFIGPLGQQLKTLTDLLANTASGTGAFRNQRAVGLAHSVLANIAEIAIEQNAIQATPASSRLLQLDNLIADNMSEGWTASDYASALALTTGHLSRLCRGATGQGAAAYIEIRMVEEACRMLAFTQLPVSEIGYRLGYGDPSYFSKRFRVSRGETPSQYRARFTN